MMDAVINVGTGDRQREVGADHGEAPAYEGDMARGSCTLPPAARCVVLVGRLAIFIYSLIVYSRRAIACTAHVRPETLYFRERHRAQHTLHSPREHRTKSLAFAAHARYHLTCKSARCRAG